MAPAYSIEGAGVRRAGGSLVTHPPASLGLPSKSSGGPRCSCSRFGFTMTQTAVPCARCMCAGARLPSLPPTLTRLVLGFVFLSLGSTEAHYVYQPGFRLTAVFLSARVTGVSRHAQLPSLWNSPQPHTCLSICCAFCLCPEPAFGRSLYHFLEACGRSSKQPIFSTAESGPAEP